MRLFHFISLFIIIIFLPLLVVEIKYSYTNETMKENQKFELNMTTAVDDATDTLRTSVKEKLELGGDYYKINPLNPQPVFDSFLRTLALNFESADPYTIDRLSRYVPAFGILDYDGLRLNVYKQYTDKDGYPLLARVWLPKIPFSYKDEEGNIINFTINDELEVYDRELNEWIEGRRPVLLKDSEITIPLLSSNNFENVRRTTIVNTIQKHLAYYINEHNVYAKSLGITYEFALPLIDKEDWFNTVDDVTILAFFQGYPSKYDVIEYQKYAFAGARIQFNDRVLAGIIDGKKFFWEERCNFPYKAIELYNSKKDAAASGYFEKSCLNPLN